MVAFDVLTEHIHDVLGPSATWEILQQYVEHTDVVARKNDEGEFVFPLPQPVLVHGEAQFSIRDVRLELHTTQSGVGYVLSTEAGDVLHSGVLPEGEGTISQLEKGKELRVSWYRPDLGAAPATIIEVSNGEAYARVQAVREPITIPRSELEALAKRYAPPASSVSTKVGELQQRITTLQAELAAARKAKPQSAGGRREKTVSKADYDKITAEKQALDAIVDRANSRARELEERVEELESQGTGGTPKGYVSLDEHEAAVAERDGLEEDVERLQGLVNEQPNPVPEGSVDLAQYVPRDQYIQESQRATELEGKLGIVQAALGTAQEDLEAKQAELARARRDLEMRGQALDEKRVKPTDWVSRESHKQVVDERNDARARVEELEDFKTQKDLTKTKEYQSLHQARDDLTRKYKAEHKDHKALKRRYDALERRAHESAERIKTLYREKTTALMKLSERGSNQGEAQQLFEGTASKMGYVKAGDAEGISDLQEQLKTAQGELAAARDEHDETRAELDRIRTEYENHVAPDEHKTVKGALDTLRSRVEGLETRLQEAAELQAMTEGEVEAAQAAVPNPDAYVSKDAYDLRGRELGAAASDNDALSATNSALQKENEGLRVRTIIVSDDELERLKAELATKQQVIEALSGEDATSDLVGVIQRLSEEKRQAHPVILGNGSSADGVTVSFDLAYGIARQLGYELREGDPNWQGNFKSALREVAHQGMPTVDDIVTAVGARVAEQAGERIATKVIESLPSAGMPTLPPSAAGLLPAPTQVPDLDALAAKVGDIVAERFQGAAIPLPGPTAPTPVYTSLHRELAYAVMKHLVRTRQYTAEGIALGAEPKKYKIARHGRELAMGVERNWKRMALTPNHLPKNKDTMEQGRARSSIRQAYVKIAQETFKMGKHGNKVKYSVLDIKLLGLYAQATTDRVTTFSRLEQHLGIGRDLADRAITAGLLQTSKGTVEINYPRVNKLIVDLASLIRENHETWFTQAVGELREDECVDLLGKKPSVSLKKALTAKAVNYDDERYYPDAITNDKDKLFYDLGAALVQQLQQKGMYSAEGVKLGPNEEHAKIVGHDKKLRVRYHRNLMALNEKHLPRSQVRASGKKDPGMNLLTVTYGRCLNQGYKDHIGTSRGFSIDQEIPAHAILFMGLAVNGALSGKYKTQTELEDMLGWDEDLANRAQNAKLITQTKAGKFEWASLRRALRGVYPIFAEHHGGMGEKIEFRKRATDRATQSSPQPSTPPTSPPTPPPDPQGTYDPEAEYIPILLANVMGVWSMPTMKRTVLARLKAAGITRSRIMVGGADVYCFGDIGHRLDELFDGLTWQPKKQYNPAVKQRVLSYFNGEQHEDWSPELWEDTKCVTGRDLMLAYRKTSSGVKFVLSEKAPGVRPVGERKAWKVRLQEYCWGDIKHAFADLSKAPHLHLRRPYEVLQ